jgi:hypothetical protein
MRNAEISQQISKGRSAERISMEEKLFPDPTPKMKISNGILEVSRSILLKLPYWFKPFYQ